MKREKPIYTLDLETDPFQNGRLPRPFCVGFYDGKDFTYTWGKGCIARMMEHLTSIKPGIIYVHNGGKFDFHFMAEYFRGEMMVIGSRIVQGELESGHEMRDSVAIYPMRLASYNKDEIDYAKLEDSEREANKDEIISYLKSDCKYLREICVRFIEEFGYNLTIGSAAMGRLSDIHRYYQMNKMEDSIFRNYFYGGRVQCFEKGVLNGRFSVYDVNSMYPYSMKKFEHPVGEAFHVGNRVTKDTCFVTVKGRNMGAFPYREKASLRFTEESGTFNVSIHEWNCALETGMFSPEKVLRTIDFKVRTNFEEFVDTYYGKRMESKQKGDKLATNFYKLILNSAYGKFAQDPSKFKEYKFASADNPPGQTQGWLLECAYEATGYSLYSRRADYKRKQSGYYNVAIAASITGAARSILMRAIHAAKRPVYCDTDSIICESLSGVGVSENALGDWKLEATGDTIACAGKKMYALMKDGETVKLASKGCSLDAKGIFAIAGGETVRWSNLAPTYKIGKGGKFISRNIRMT